MNLLLDTHVVLWAAGDAKRLSAASRAALGDAANAIYFSPVSLWEIVIKSNLGRADFSVDPRRLWRMLGANGFLELPVRAEHTLAVAGLPDTHKDPFDRLLLAQAACEGMILLTADDDVLAYGGPTKRA